MAAQLYKTESGRLFHAGSVAIITVGYLPARGKTHVSRSLCRYLDWVGVTTQVFSVGVYRRKHMGNNVESTTFDPENAEGVAQRLKYADLCFAEMVEWLKAGKGQVAIFDGNNATEARRKSLYDRLLEDDIHPLFIESICDKQEIVLANIRNVKVLSPDYIGWEADDVVQDYKKRIEQQESVYETIADTKLPFVKLINVGERLIVNKVQGYLQSRIVYYLMNLHNQPRTVYFAREGKSLDEQLYKKDADLSPEGLQYAERLEKFLLDYRAKRALATTTEMEEKTLSVWTSTQKKGRQTAAVFIQDHVAVRNYSVLNQLNPGVLDGLTPEQVNEKYPDEVNRAKAEPYRYRFPRAESYHDLAVRLEAVIMELEREKNDVLIIAHETVLRCLYAYFFDLPETDIPSLKIPRKNVIAVTPSAYGCKEEVLSICTDAEK
ncbi:6-phosphofructo-2-kinase-domain-containing protein [Syncephalastrum racemosum]|uniref:6-phosphofructo-2-kinase-domain-containing protein n=1 Tax=Syncephalastrum racemosum TaxID=13706 RepID=A0A1X2H3Y0_SYNRA|nr:6-phosphofructo-2-kinase-domain-containing protein [Syncephalastrum racemosum]